MTQKRMTRAAWEAEARRRFGDDHLHWKFVCPVCGHVQAVRDFRQYKDKGANPNDAYQNCIGRYIEGSRSAFNGKGPGPCTYAGYGLFRLAPTVVVDDGSETQVFDFAPAR